MKEARFPTTCSPIIPFLELFPAYCETFCTAFLELKAKKPILVREKLAKPRGSNPLLALRVGCDWQLEMQQLKLSSTLKLCPFEKLDLYFVISPDVGPGTRLT